MRGIIKEEGVRKEPIEPCHVFDITIAIDVEEWEWGCWGLTDRDERTNAGPFCLSCNLWNMK